jgi:hypothetical protein
VSHLGQVESPRGRVFCSTSPRVNISSLLTHLTAVDYLLLIITNRVTPPTVSQTPDKDVILCRHRTPARLPHRNTDCTFHLRRLLPTTAQPVVVSPQLDSAQETTALSFASSPKTVHPAFAFRAFKYAVSLEATARCTSASLFGHSSHLTGYHCSDL